MLYAADAADIRQTRDALFAMDAISPTLFMLLRRATDAMPAASAAIFATPITMSRDDFSAAFHAAIAATLLQRAICRR